MNFKIAGPIDFYILGAVKLNKLKKTITLIITVITVLLSLKTFSQSWSSPKLIESLSGVGGNAGQYSSLLVVNGNPAMAYYDATRANLMYVRALDASGFTWGAPVIVDTTGNVGQYTSMQIINGNPAISYYDVINGDLKYVRAIDVSGAAWGTSVSVDVSGDMGRYNSLQMVNGHPAISYYDGTNDDLKYIRASDALGLAWGMSISVDITGWVGRYTSLQVVNGFPAITYYDQTNNDLKYARATNASGTTWASGIPVDAASGTVQNTSLQIVNGNPAVSYSSGSNLKYIRSTDASGFAWIPPVSIDVSGLHASLQIVLGYPAISYYDVVNGNLKYALASDSIGAAWSVPVIVESVGDVGYYSRLQVVNGMPAISYYDATNTNLKYKRAVTVSGSVWTVPGTIESTGNIGEYTSMQIVNGNPAISYWDVTNLDLKYKRALDPSGISWAASVSVDVGGSVGQFSSLQVANGNPAIAYFDNTNGVLKYARANDATGANWGTPIIIDGTPNVGRYACMQIVNGNPAVSYYDSGNGNLKYVRANNPSGTSWGTPVSIDVSGSAGTSMFVVNGNPAISYYSSASGTLKYVRASDPSGITWAASVTIDATGIVGLDPSLNVVNGNPAIAYYDATNQDLKYVRSNDATGSSWPVGIAIDVVGNTGQSTSLKIVNGYPAISYHGNYALKYIRATNASGTSWATPLVVDAVGYSGQFTCMQVVNGSPAISHYDPGNGDLKYKRAYDTLGDLWNITQDSFDATGDVGKQTSISMINGKPAVAYFDVTNGDLKYVRATNSVGTAWGTPVKVDANNIAPNTISLHDVNGMPAIVYFEYTVGMRYVRATDSAGTAWGTPLFITGASDFFTLLMVNGFPAVSFLNNNTTKLNFRRATNASGTAWAPALVLDPVAYNGLYASMQIVNGMPAISYLDVTNSDLKYIRATNASGTAWGAPVTIDPDGGGPTSLQIVNAFPAICYGFAPALKYVRALDSSGVTWAAADTIDVSGVNFQSPSLQIINGKPAVSYYDKTNDDLKYISASDVFGVTWDTPVTLDAIGITGQYSSMIPIESGALTAYYNASAKLPFVVSGIFPCGTNPTVPSVIASDPMICTGGSTTLSVASGTLNDAAYWQWYSGSCAGIPIGIGFSLIVSPNVTTTYYAKGAGGCATPDICDSVTVTVNPLPSVNITGITTVCNGNSTTLSATGASTYSWSSGGSASTEAVMPNVNTIYTVTGTDVNGCSNTAAAMVTVNALPAIPIITSTGATTFCQGDSVILTSSISNIYLWSNGATTQSIIVSSSQNDSVTVTDLNGCSVTSVPTIITVNPLPNPIITPGGPTTFCSGNSLVLDAGAGFVSYLWSDGSTSQSITVSSSQNDSVTVTDANACSATSNSIMVTVHPSPVALVSTSGPTSFCLGDSVILTANTSNSYLWSNGATTQSITILTSQYDSVIVTDLNGCSDASGSIAVEVNEDCNVWPGDADADNVVNNFDLLPVGLFYSQSGFPRAGISNSWQAYLSTDWGITQTNGVDIKHADCNGDGIIDNNDTLAINLNFSSAHAIVSTHFNEERTTDPEFYFVTSSASYNAGDWVDVEVWTGSSILPVSNLYGIAFNINYDASLVQSGTESIDYSTGWLGIPGTNAITISRIDPLANTAYGAITRIDHINAGGYGKIADFKFQAETSITSPSVLHLSVSGYKANDTAGIPVIFNVSADSIIINPLGTGVFDVTETSEITISPNPFTSQTTIVFNEEQKYTTIKIMDVFGKEIKTISFSGKQLIIEKGEMTKGVYFVQIMEEHKKIINKKIIVQ